MSDPLSVTASIIAVLQLAKATVDYIRDIKNASKDCRRLVVEISSVRGILAELVQTIEDATSRSISSGESDASSDQIEEQSSWSATFALLREPGGPVEILREALQELESKLSKAISSSAFRKLKHSLLWPLTKKQTDDLTCIIERQKSLLALALGNDHFLLSRSIKETL